MFWDEGREPMTSPAPRWAEWEVFQHTLTSHFRLILLLSLQLQLKFLVSSVIPLFLISLSCSACPQHLRWEASVAGCSLMVWLTAGQLFIFLFISAALNWHMRHRHRQGQWERGEMDGQMWGLWCVFHIKDTFLDTSGLYGLIKQAYIHCRYTH